jgi:hypothetical protein
MSLDSAELTSLHPEINLSRLVDVVQEKRAVA